ncbi:GNAT family N-acetyltransferase [Methylocystis parvus]|nr:GNAT family N-acetyltransferase [Methylocystis parvus]WBK01012.1 GNAT family N-acetyltransferase [Methylocystis parvus OBBP]
MTSACLTDANYRIEVVRTYERFVEIGPQWRDICEDAGASLFQSHAWIGAWAGAATDGDARDLRVVVAWRGDRIDAVAPFAIRRTCGLRILQWAAQGYSDYCDAVLRPGAAPSLLAQMWRALEKSCAFDFAVLTDVRPGACIGVLSERAGGFLQAYHREATCSRVLSDAPTGAAWFDAHPKKFRQNYRRGLAVLEENARVTFRLLAPDEPLAPALARLCELKRLRLGEAAAHSSLFAQKGSATLNALVGAMAREGALRVFVIERDNEIIAISVNFEYRGELFAYLTAFDPAFARGSPGMALMINYIKWAIDHGLKSIDLLRGDEAFKRRVATHSITLRSLCHGRTASGRLLLAGAAIYRRLRYRAPDDDAAPAPCEGLQSRPQDANPVENNSSGTESS